MERVCVKYRWRIMTNEFCLGKKKVSDEAEAIGFADLDNSSVKVRFSHASRYTTYNLAFESTIQQWAGACPLSTNCRPIENDYSDWPMVRKVDSILTDQQKNWTAKKKQKNLRVKRESARRLFG